MTGAAYAARVATALLAATLIAIVLVGVGLIGIEAGCGRVRSCYGLESLLFALGPPLVVVVAYGGVFLATIARLRYANVSRWWLVPVAFWMLATTGLPYNAFFVSDSPGAWDVFTWMNLLSPHELMLIIFVAFLIFVPAPRSQGDPRQERGNWIGAAIAATASVAFAPQTGAVLYLIPHMSNALWGIARPVAEMVGQLPAGWWLAQIAIVGGFLLALTGIVRRRG